jgi:hypothetical protein
MAEVTFNVNEAMKQTTMEVKLTGARSLAWRIRIGILLIRTAARVMGCGVTVESELK